MDMVLKLFAHLLLAAFLCLLTLSSPGSCQQECETPVELGFLVDQSGSISTENFQKVKAFILTVIAGFNVSKEGTHVGIIKYSSNATTVLTFDQFVSPDFDFNKLNDTLEKALDEPSGGKTRIDLALAKADNELFSDPTKYRTFVPKILLVLTDGQQTRGDDIFDVNLYEASRKLSRKGVEVFVLGVGENVNIPEMLEIAADKDSNVFLAKDFDDLTAQVVYLVQSFCKVCKRNIDVAFLLPTVDSVGESGLKDIKILINSLLSTFGIQKYRGVHVALMTCAEEGKIVLKFDETYYKKEIENVVNSLEIEGRRISLEKCLKEASSNLFDVRGGVRNVVDKYLIVLGGGRSSYPKQAVAKALIPLRDEGVKIMALSLSTDRASIASMKFISNEPQSVWFKQIQRREILNAGFFARSISDKLCKEKKGKCPYNVIPEICNGDDTFNECDLDADSVSPCEDDMKCCQVGCDRQCVPPIPDCFNPVEIAFLIDTSGSQGDVDDDETLETFKKFAKELTHSFSITESAGRVAVITYNNVSIVHMGFGSQPYFWNVAKKIDSIELSNQLGRNLEEALAFVRHNVFNLKGGIRQNMPRALVVLSTGQPTSTLRTLSRTANYLKNQDVQIWAVHAGEDSSDYMNSIVSQSSFQSSSTSLLDLENFQKNFVETFCATKEGNCRSPTCSSDLGNECRKDYVCPGQEKCCPGTCTSCVQPKTDCRSPMDLAFIVQDSVDETDFHAAKKFMKGVLKALDAGRTQTWIGIITYNRVAEIKLEFSQNRGGSIAEKRKLLSDEIDKLTVSRSRSTDGAAEAFTLAKNRLFTEKAGSHLNEIRNVVLLSNGKFSEPMKVADSSLDLRWDISNVLAVIPSLDPDVSTVKGIASADAEKHVYLTTSYDALSQYENKIAVAMCKRELTQKAESEFSSSTFVGENVSVRRKRRQAIEPDLGVKPQEAPVILVKGPMGDRGLIGQKGAVGSIGLQGSEGSPGEFGPTGIAGIAGEPGKAGILGRPGPVGRPGSVSIEYSGEKGPDSAGINTIRMAQMNLSASIAQVEFAKNVKPGARGRKGQKGITGISGLEGGLGKVGENGFCGIEGPEGLGGRIGRPGEQGSLGYAGRRGGIGPNGLKGGPGEAGPKGFKGETGPLGDLGDFGLKGEDGGVGDQGELGVIGIEGPRGLKGSIGPSGLDGEVGFKGLGGDPGQVGLRGINGIKGEKGRQGAAGDSGIAGLRGTPGSIGFYGTVGEPGPIGDDGKAGPKGKRGANGKRGKESSLGEAGEMGDSGRKGDTGFQGYKGAKGLPGDTGSSAEDGETGEHGKAGDIGIPGDTGESGEPGGTGVNGESGSRGELGEKGNTGFPGRRGLEGQPGSKGEPGPDGRPGPVGRTSRPGIPGRFGPPGEKGTRGDPGKPGGRGSSGLKGFPGEVGEPGFPGLFGPPGRPGADGVFGLHGTPGNPGIMGLPGPQGETGKQGRDGQDGDPGVRGPSGEKGFPGAPGFPGPAGVTAPPGPIGFLGEPGNKGRKGAKGAVGFPGEIGEDGPIGDKGLQGPSGIPGVSGSPAAPGFHGEAGSVGDKGSAGQQGRVGTGGKRGAPGIMGLSGLPGDRGRLGIEGDTGRRGPKGLYGLFGDKGNTGRQGLPGFTGRHGDPGQNGDPWLATEDGKKGKKGAVGDVGINGRPGQSGVNGSPGVEGPPGSLGANGFQGASGQLGFPGLDGFPGLKGPIGGIGEPGIPGNNGGGGLPGSRGLVGPRGDLGPKGVSGTGTLPGEPGIRGPKGFLGSVGVSGNPGRDGRKGSKGAVGLFGNKGENGTQGIVGENGGDGETGARGAKGLKGEMGVVGEPGVVEHGDVGPPGLNGSLGEPGENGEPGEPGKKGEQGMEGIQGIQGSRGGDGERGLRGGNGIAGAIGFKGEAPAKGLKGMPGTVGKPGQSVNGTLGLPGPQGNPGVDGLAGLRGEKGKTGVLGQRGSLGLRGEDGTLGKTGDTGKVGNKGMKGETGQPGINATQGGNGNKGKIGPPGQGLKGDRGTIGLRGPDGALGEPGPAVSGSMGPEGERGKKGTTGKRGPPGPPGLQGPQAISYNGTTISIRHNTSYTEYIQTDMNLNISKRYFSLQLKMALHKKPDGTKKYPAISCAELYKNYPTLDSAYYWIDPNEGSHEDAEQVYCYFQRNATCLDPVTNKTENKKWFTGSDGYKWFTEELVGVQYADKFNYAFDDVQLQMLQLHSNEAWQKITYHCLNSMVWSNNSFSLIENSIKLQGDDDHEFHNKMPRKLRPVTIEDNCQIKDGQWNQTIIEVRSQNPLHLPIRDVAVYDIGDDGEEFGLELGRVCFSP